MSAPSLFDPVAGATPPDPAPAPAASAAVPQARAETRSLYRKYRPQTFDANDLVGQDHIVRTLRNAIALGRVSHAYLFCGPRGTGKTSTARLLAKAVNCLDPDPAHRPCNACPSCLAIASGSATDVIEIDAASNRGIDDIRDLRERVKYAPVQLTTKVYIIDEAHQITGAAANAFLKTLEEPPAHTKFVLATTDPEELLPTIVSRCQRFDFRRIGLEAIVAHLQTVAAAEGLTVDPAALAIVARHATGSLRDALGLLDQLAVYREEAGAADGVVTPDLVRALLGVSRNERVESLVGALADRDAGAALGAVNAAAEAGEDPRQLNRQLVAYLRVLLHERAAASPDADDRARALAARFDLQELATLARRFSEVDYKLKHSSYGHLPLEIALVDGVLRGAPTAATAPQPAATAPDTAPTSPARSRPALTPDPAVWDDGASPPPSAAPAPRPPSTSLRDRVRGVSSSPTAPTPAAPPMPAPVAALPPPTAQLAPVQTAPPPPAASASAAAPSPAAPTPPPATPSSVSALAAPPDPATPSSSSAPAAPPDPATPSSSSDPSVSPVSPSETQQPVPPLDVERLIDLWPRIRQDVKAVNRRIEALLSSVDPTHVDGAKITLAAAYPFHRDKLNTDDVRAIVEDAISRHVGARVSVWSLLRNEPGGTPADPPPPTPIAPPSSTTDGMPAAPPPARTAEPPAPAYAVAADALSPIDLEADERRLTAAKNIFDAEEIAAPR